MAALLGRNLLREFEGVMETPSQAGRALVKLCELLPNNEDGEAIKTVLTRVADHLMPRHEVVRCSSENSLDGLPILFVGEEPAKLD